MLNWTPRITKAKAICFRMLAQSVLLKTIANGISSSRILESCLDRVRREIHEEHKKVTDTSAVFEADTVTKRRKLCVPVLTEEIIKEIIGRSTNQFVKDLLLRFLDPEDKDSTPVLRKAICIGLFFNSVGGHVSAWWAIFVVALGFGCSKTPDYFGGKQLLFFWENIRSIGLIGSTFRTKFIAKFLLVHCGHDGSADLDMLQFPIPRNPSI
jgi:hypothetical protein